MTKSDSNLTITFINECSDAALPQASFFEDCLSTAWDQLSKEPNTLTIKLVNADAMTELNRDFFGKDRPTNVLSFPFEPFPGYEETSLGDIAICIAVVKDEAKSFDMPFQHRLAHMLIHGLLHLMGYDHIDDADRETMEALEVKLLLEQGFSHPYET